MSDALNGQVFFAGAGITLHSWTITRPTTDTTTVYTDAAVELAIYAQDKKGTPTGTTPALTLTIDAGLTRTTNTASVQAGSLEISVAQVTTLIGAADAVRFGYLWAITPTGFAKARKPMTGGFDGYFVIAKPGYAGALTTTATTESVIKLP